MPMERSSSARSKRTLSRRGGHADRRRGSSCEPRPPKGRTTEAHGLFKERHTRNEIEIVAVPTTATLIAFLAAVLAMQAVPGPDTMLVVSRGLGQGRRIAVWTAVGAVSAGIVQLLLLA